MTRPDTPKRQDAGTDNESEWTQSTSEKEEEHPDPGHEVEVQGEEEEDKDDTTRDPPDMSCLSQPQNPPSMEPNPTQPQTPVPSSQMLTRKADEADLSDGHEEHSATRPRTNISEKEQQENDKVIRDPALDLDAVNLLPIPRHNQLDIHGWDEHTTLENLNLAQRAMWTTEKGAKVLAYKAYGGRLDGAEEAMKLREAIKSALDITTNPTVAVPIPDTAGNRKDFPPFCALVKGITPEKAQELIKRVSRRLSTHNANTDNPDRDSCRSKASRRCSSPSHPPPTRSSQPSRDSYSSTNPKPRQQRRWKR